MNIKDLPERMPDRRGANRGAWDTETIDRLKKLHADGMTFTDIAAELGHGLSRNACIGKALRLGLVKRGVGVKPRSKPRATRTRTIVAIRGRSTGAVEIGEQEMPPMQVGIPAEDIPVEQRKQLQELKSHHCRWPYGDPGKADFFFCGGPKIPCLSYCAAHARIAFRRAA